MRQYIAGTEKKDMCDRYCVIIVTYNRIELLKECIKHVLEQSKKVSDLVIVNNCSSDGTYEYLLGLNDNRIHVINEKENLGGAGGFEEGVKAALTTDSDWFVLIDDDAMIDEDYINNLHSGAIIHKKCKAFSGTVMEHGSIAVNHRRRFIDVDAPVDKKEYDGNYFSYDCSSFCGLTVARSIVEKIGIPKGEMFIWFDDTDYSLRIRKYTEIINVNEAIIVHKTKMPSENSTHWDEWRTYYGLRNRIYAYSRNGHFVYSLKIIKNDFQRIYKLKPEAKYTKEQVRSLQKVFKEAVCDGLFGKLGKNEKYMPH